MTRGIYLLANDRVLDPAIACVHSIRRWDPEVDVLVIPYDDRYGRVATRLAEQGVTLFPDLDLVERISDHVRSVFGDGLLPRPANLRKAACWLGPCERFLYLDVDTVVLGRVARLLDHLDDCDFLCHDHQHKEGVRNVFSPRMAEEGPLGPGELRDVFNTGFWASRRDLVTEEDLLVTFGECRDHLDWLDFSGGTSDQPVLNYLVLRRLPRRRNLARRPGGGPGSWAGTPDFRREGWKLIDPRVGEPLEYLHWAGIRLEPGCPYWELWSDYRYPDGPGTRPEEAEGRAGGGVRSWLRRLGGRLGG